MVHKKSEYMLQFHKMSKDLRWQIYKDNIQFREFRRMDNKADHYWSDQLTDEKCECENDSSNDEETSFGIPPLFKLKHKALLNSYNIRKAAAASQEIAVQTPDWQKPDSRRVDIPAPQRVHSAVNTDPEISTPTERIATSRPANPTPPISPTDQGGYTKEIYPSCTDSCQMSNQRQNTPNRITPNVINCALSAVSTSERTLRTSPPCTTPGPQEPLLPSQRTMERTKTPRSVFAAKSTQGVSSSHFLSSSTRTNKRLYSEGKKTHFVPYGWNDTHSDIGHKKTHNVCAPSDQVYSSALEALRLRRTDVENQLALEAERRRKLKGGMAPVNHSSIWTTEYREKFRPCPARFTPSARPHTSPPLRACVGHSTCHRPLSYRYS